VNETTCFGLDGGHHQVYNVGFKRQIIMSVADVEISSSYFTKYRMRQKEHPDLGGA